jgi:4-hydroxyacetophenone monooxygenase
MSLLDELPFANESSFTDAQVAHALSEASIPTLVMCLAQITGDPHWLTQPFQATRDTNLFADETGGLAPDVQEEVRHAMQAILVELSQGTRALPVQFDFSAFPKMMSTCLGEEVPAEYTPMMAEEMQLSDRDVHWTSERPAEKLQNFHTIILGAGFAGLCAAIKLDRLGISWELLEKNSDLGGTWFENRYPDAGVDTPNHFYSYSFEPNTRWTGYFSKRDELWHYAQDVAAKHQLIERIKFSTEVTSLQWDGETSQWVVTSKSQTGEVQTRRANAVITAVGQLNRPKIPNLPGLHDFPGEQFHTACWPDNISLAGKRVGIVGTGASSMQLLPKVAAEAEHVTIFQRSAQWVRPTQDYHKTVKPEMIWLLENVPYYANWYRFGLLWRFADGLLGSLRRDPDWPHPERSMNRRNDRHRVQMTDYLVQELGERNDLIEKSLPTYPPYGKRILVDNHWFKTLQRDNVALVTSAVSYIDGISIVAEDESAHSVDVIILATGFETGKLLSPIEVRGRSGTPIAEVWGEDNPRAYLGVSVPDYPNLFAMMGPGTGIAHGGSAIFQAECQIRYITSCLVQMIESDLASIEVSETVHDEYNQRFDAEHRELVWSHPGMRNWYRNENGRVFGPMPWRLVDYWSMTHDADLSCYRVT